MTSSQSCRPVPRYSSAVPIDADDIFSRVLDATSSRQLRVLNGILTSAIVEIALRQA